MSSETAPWGDRALYLAPYLDDEDNYGDATSASEKRYPVPDAALANLVSSHVAGKPGTHKPVLDLDFPCLTWPCTEDGRTLLFLDKELSEYGYGRLYLALLHAGVTEEARDPVAVPLVFRPLLDLGFPVTLVPSTTPGHFHAYLGKELSWTAYAELLRQLCIAGVVETGFYAMSLRRGATFVRKPGVRKEHFT
jgi:hypothetical protein